jgi:hypothetical protein
MSFKQLIFIALILGLALGELTFLEQSNNGVGNGNGRKMIDFYITRPCYKNFSEGECAGLQPAATACVWQPHAQNGWCSHKKNENTYSNVFTMA